MSLLKKGSPIGILDGYYREICVGDEVADAAGKHYTINAYGYAKPLSGGREVPAKSLRNPAVVIPFDTTAPAPFAEKDGRVVPAVQVSGPSGDVPTKEELMALPPRKQLVNRDRISAATNKSGASQIGNITKGLAVTGKEARKILEDAGFLVFPDKAGRACIRRKDRARALELIMAKAEEPRPVKTEASGKQPAADVEVVEVVKDMLPPPLSPEEVEAVKSGRLPVEIRHREPVTETPEKVFNKDEAFLLLDDRDLADELRRRGYDVVAVTNIVL